MRSLWIRSWPGALMVLVLLGVAAAQRPTLPAAQARSASLHETLSWTVEYAEPGESPFDLEATAVFTHESGRTASTELFWVGDGRFEFRFTPLLTGSWRFETHSDIPELDAITGAVSAAAGDLPGALTSEGTKFARTHDGEVRGALHHPYRLHEGSDLVDYPADLEAAEQRIVEALDTVESQGFQSIFFSLQHTLFGVGARSYDDHDRTEPDLTAFAILDLLLRHAHARGMTVHFWLWGDERRKQTPQGLPGGVNGPVDRRLQRYIAARLGPMPGWTMAYGFDLEEWAGPAEVRSWAEYMQSRMHVPHLLTAREKNPRGGFDLGAEKLSLFSTDDRPSERPEDCYGLAVARLSEQDGHQPLVPVLFERRFLFMRDDYWTEDRTRRCLWQLTVAGGAGAIWGQPFSEARSYPTPRFYRTFFEFWQHRFLVDMERVPTPSGAWALGTPDGRHRVLYAEDTDTVELDLASMDSEAPIVAVDTVSGTTYQIGSVEPGAYVWNAPGRSDWAIAIGDFR